MSSRFDATLLLLPDLALFLLLVTLDVRAFALTGLLVGLVAVLALALTILTLTLLLLRIALLVLLIHVTSSPRDDSQMIGCRARSG